MKAKHKLIAVVAASLLAIGCQQGSDMAVGGNEAGTGQGGSMARFAITGNNLYAVTDQDLLVLDQSIALGDR